MLRTALFVAVALFAGSALGGCLPPQGQLGKTLVSHPRHKLGIAKGTLPTGVQQQSVNVQSCGSAYTQATATVTTYAHAYVLTITGQSNAECGTPVPVNFQQIVPYSTAPVFNNDVVFWGDQTGCGGNCWDLGGMVTIDGGACDYGICTLTVIVTSCHGAVSGCSCSPGFAQQTMPFNFGNSTSSV